MTNSTMYSILLLLLIDLISWINCDLTKEQLMTDDLPPRGFGKYMITTRTLEKCDSMEKPVDVNKLVSYDLNAIKLNETDEDLTGYVLVPKTYHCIKARMTPMILRDGVLNPTLNRTTTDPCNDIIMAFPIKKFFIVDKNCNIKGGNYSINGLNINKWMHLLTGDNFIYGRTLITVEYFSPIGTTFCIFAAVDIKPIPKIKRKIKSQKKPRKS